MPGSPAEYLRLEPEQRQRFDPMITGFEPRRHVRGRPHPAGPRDIPGVFTGIGEFTIHKEFVSSKIARATASLNNPALDRMFELAGEIGLVRDTAQRHRRTFAKAGASPCTCSR